MARTAAL